MSGLMLAMMLTRCTRVQAKQWKGNKLTAGQAKLSSNQGQAAVQLHPSAISPLQCFMHVHRAYWGEVGGKRLIR
jgi:hypothetical protein